MLKFLLCSEDNAQLLEVPGANRNCLRIIFIFVFIFTFCLCPTSDHNIHMDLLGRRLLGGMVAWIYI